MNNFAIYIVVMLMLGSLAMHRIEIKKLKKKVTLITNIIKLKEVK